MNNKDDGKGYPRISSTPPGRNAKEWVERDKRVISQSYTRSYPLVVERGEGASIIDVDGMRYLDFTSGIAVTSTGHCHPKVVDAIKKQAETLIHMSGTDFYYPSEVRLAEKLVSITPGKNQKKVFFTNSGAESTEAAMKLARYHTKRPHFIAFYGGFHGRTMGALSVTASKPVHRRGFSPLIPEVTHIPYAYCYRCPFSLEPDRCDIECLGFLKDIVFKHKIPPEEVAAIFVEPIQGEGGYVIPPKPFMSRLQSIAKEFGILLIADEIQTGMGRTGKMFASEHFGLLPDIITIAKGIASGMPLGAMVANSDVMDWESGSHANTFGGNPIACEAALATIEILEEGLIQNAEKVGRYILLRLDQMMKVHPLIGDVRGMGLMIGVELVRDRKTKEMATTERSEVIQAAFKKGLLILGCGYNVIRFMPPLIITEDDADKALSIFDEVLTEVEQKK
ncbi:MAG TPA: acetyl ornithine aminotransferase family protein [Nitrospiria bacterium]|nr:acetyl ornithine aminotransferase family protein [Nitrospiria bacterium]